MKKIVVLLYFVFFAFWLKGQTCIERINKAGFQYFSIPDKEYKEVDSIRFIVSNPINSEHPTIIFLQGSGNFPLIAYLPDNSNDFNVIPPFRIDSYQNKYNFVCISKPSTPLCREFTDNNPLIIDTTFTDVMTFIKMDFLDYYVAQTGQVIDYLQANILKKNVPIILIGNSQGGRVAVKYTALNSSKIQKLVLYSSNVLDRNMEEIYKWRQFSDSKQISSEEAQKNIEYIYESYINLKNYANYYKNNLEKIDENNLLNHYSALTSYTYNFYIPLEHLLKINIPVLCVYGTDDLKTRDNDMLPLFFIRANKTNLTMLPILNCDHFFVERLIDKETGEKKEKYLGNEVFEKIEKWISVKEWKNGGL